MFGAAAAMPGLPLLSPPACLGRLPLLEEKGGGGSWRSQRVAATKRDSVCIVWCNERRWGSVASIVWPRACALVGTARHFPQQECDSMMQRASTTQRRGVVVQSNQGPFGCGRRHAANPTRPVRQSPGIDGRCLGSSERHRCGSGRGQGPLFGKGRHGSLTCGSSRHLGSRGGSAS